MRAAEDNGGPNASCGQRVENPDDKVYADVDGSEKTIHINLLLFQHKKVRYN
jgi:hypothetical protein